MARNKLPRSDRSEGETQETSRWKYLAFAALFTFPALIYVSEAVISIFKSFSSASNIPSFVYIVFTATVVVVLWLYLRTTLQGYNKYFMLLLFPVFLFPSLRVYTCSPVVLVNKDFGTRFKLGTTAAEILQDCGEECLEQFGRSLYSLSLVTPRVTLKVMSSEVVDLNVTTNSIVGGETLKTSRLYLIYSLRSVRGKVHSLTMITKVPFRLKKITEALEKKQTMELTGRIVKIGADFKEMKANLERNKLFVRPIVFEPYRVKVNDDSEL